MKTKSLNPVASAAVVFAGLAIITIVLIFVASTLADLFAQNMVTGLGSAVFGAGLAFFLLRIFQSQEQAS